MTLRNFIRALDANDTVTVVEALNDHIFFDRKTRRELEAAPLFQVACLHMHVYRVNIGKCFGDLIVRVVKDWQD